MNPFQDPCRIVHVFQNVPQSHPIEGVVFEGGVLHKTHRNIQLILIAGVIRVTLIGLDALGVASQLFQQIQKFTAARAHIQNFQLRRKQMPNRGEAVQGDMSGPENMLFSRREGSFIFNAVILLIIRDRVHGKRMAPDQTAFCANNCIERRIAPAYLR